MRKSKYLRIIQKKVFHPRFTQQDRRHSFRVLLQTLQKQMEIEITANILEGKLSQAIIQLSRLALIVKQIVLYPLEW